MSRYWNPDWERPPLVVTGRIDEDRLAAAGPLVAAALPKEFHNAQFCPGRDGITRHAVYTSREDYIFCSRLGRRLDPSAVRRRFKSARDAAGLRPLRFHALRHAAGSLVARHADARFVQEFLVSAPVQNSPPFAG